MTGDAATTILLVLYSALLLGGAAQDVASLRISNLISVALLAVGAAALVLSPGPAWWEHLLAFAITLTVGMGLFSLKWLGGGDAKLMAAAALAFDLGGLLRFVPSVLILGGLVALLTIVARLLFGGRKPLAERKGIPYGVAIAAGALAVVWLFPIFSVFGR